MTIRKVNFGVFPELSPCFRYSIDNRWTKRRCLTCKTRASTLYAQDPGSEGPQLANAPRSPAWCWACAVEAQMVMLKLSAASDGPTS